MIVKSHRPRITVDMRGKITSGKKNDKGMPQKLDYFDVSDFPELKVIYGEKPTKILVYVPTDDPIDFYESAYNSWYTANGGTSGKKRCCDGEICVHRIQETIAGKTYGAGEESPCICKDLPDGDKNKCRFDCYFKVFIGDPVRGKIINPSCYMFSTHSQNSADAILSELNKMKDINNGIIRGLPFLLTVKMATSSKDNQKKFPIWSLQAWGTMESLGKISGNFALAGIKTPLIEYQSKGEGAE